jgi:hypothetical protein
MRTTIDLPALAELIEDGGSFSISTLAEYGCVAAASDGDNCLAMLARRDDESLSALLKRLDAAIVEAAETGTNIDEVNEPAEPTASPERKQTRRSRR